MAKSCHDRKTARRDGGFGNKETPPSFSCVQDVDREPKHVQEIANQKIPLESD